MAVFPLPLIYCFLFLFIGTGMSDLNSDRLALMALRSAVRGRTLRWNVTGDQNPCDWTGVQCEGGEVTVLRLPGASLAGQLPDGIFGNLTHLRTLSFRLNSLTGTLPADLAACTDLQNLYLQGNRFSGGVPEALLSLKSLVRLNLADNKFAGEFPAGFNDLIRLRTLYLEKNNLTGPIPDLKLPKLAQFNVSYNNLTGSIPAGLRGRPRAEFLGNAMLCGFPLDTCPGTVNEPPLSPPPSPRPNGTLPDAGSGGKKKLSGGGIAGIVFASVLAFLIILMLILCCQKKSKKNKRPVDIASLKQLETGMNGAKQDRDVGNVGNVEDVENVGNAGLGNGSNRYTTTATTTTAVAAVAAVANNDVNGNDDDAKGSVDNAATTTTKKLIFFPNAPRVFDYEALLRASAEILGEGTFGIAYKANLEVGPPVAVKRLKNVTISESEFAAKIQGVGAMDHVNLVPLRAYNFSKEEKLIVCDYMPTGSLFAFLHGNKGAGRTPLNWELRSAIALGAARGVQYIHSRGPNVSHGNIKSSNILLTESYEARVSDFGLAHLIGPSATPNRRDGYRAPEVTDARKISQKADVYSFGVLLLELLTGKAPNHAILNEVGVDLPRWVHSVVREEWMSEIFDLELLRHQHDELQMDNLLQLASDCAALYPDNRPTMSQVTTRIEDICRSSLH